ncbi:hypothetical protein HispidOSU_027095 [Sigmodon hispidus]
MAGQAEGSTTVLWERLSVSSVLHLWVKELGPGARLWDETDFIRATAHSGSTLLRKRFFTTLTTSPGCLGNTLRGQEELGTVTQQQVVASLPPSSEASPPGPYRQLLAPFRHALGRRALKNRNPRSTQGEELDKLDRRPAHRTAKVQQGGQPGHFRGQRLKQDLRALDLELSPSGPGLALRPVTEREPPLSRGKTLPSSFATKKPIRRAKSMGRQERGG